MTKDEREAKRRQYPPIYEKIIPIALALIGLAIVVMLALILGVALDLIPGM